jgi:AAA15 family ATPase/GTPase
MLVNFKVKNYRSFYGETLFSMQAVPNKEFAEQNTFTVDEKLLTKGENELLKSAVIFGSNASGKTNLIKALRYMKDLVLSSTNFAFPAVLRNEPFLFYKDAIDEPTSFEIEIITNETYYDYGFEIKQRQIVNEYFSKRKERKAKIFSRDDSGISVTGIQKNQSIGQAFEGFNPQFLFLPFFANLKHEFTEDVNAVIRWFANLTVFVEDEFQNVMNNFDIYSEENNKYKSVALEILKQADIGINDFCVIKDKMGEVNDLGFPLAITLGRPQQIKQENKEVFNIDLETTFKVYDKDDNAIEKLAKPIRLLKNMGFHSNGTFRLMSFLGLILKTIDRGGVIILDEVDAQIHFLVVDYILGLFNSIANNPKNAQLVCTVHNVLLMDDNLRRDQIYFTKKDEIGKTELFSLADFEGVRSNDLFSKKYLAGFYSAIPKIMEGV